MVFRLRVRPPLVKIVFLKKYHSFPMVGEIAKERPYLNFEANSFRLWNLRYGFSFAISPASNKDYISWENSFFPNGGWNRKRTAISYLWSSQSSSLKLKVWSFVCDFAHHWVRLNSLRINHLSKWWAKSQKNSHTATFKHTVSTLKLKVWLFVCDFAHH